MEVTKKFLDTSFGRIAYIESGNDKHMPVLFVHGIPTSSYLWRNVIPMLHSDFKCYAPDLMGLGDTDVDPDTGHFDMDSQADMLLEFMTKLGHERFALVCHDQGGAAAQILATRFPERVIAFVITDAVAYDNWPVPVIARLQRLARLPGTDLFAGKGLMTFLETSTPLSAYRRGVYDPSAFSAEAIREYLRPLTESDRSRKRFLKFLLAGSARYTQVIAPALRTFPRPTLVIWAGDDHYISPSWGKKLQEDIPGARFELVPFCGHFWQEERPAEFAGIMGKFLAEQASAEAFANSKKLAAKNAAAETSVAEAPAAEATAAKKKPAAKPQPEVHSA